MVREHLSALTISGGRQFLEITDALGMQAQGAMWVMNHHLKDWRLYLITSLVETLGRRRTYKHILEIFDNFEVGQGISSDDIYLASPSDSLFQLVSQIFQGDNVEIAFEDCSFNGVPFDGLVYRSIATLPSEQESARIAKQFQKKLKDATASKNKNLVSYASPKDHAKI